MKTVCLTIFATLAFSLPSTAKLIPINYDTELCSCQAKVDSSKISKKAIENAFNMPSPPEEKLSWTDYNSQTPDMLKRIREKYQQAYREFESKLKNLELPNFKEWTAHRNNLLKNAEFDSQKYIRSLTYYETRNTDLLLSDLAGVKIPAKCQEYGKSLKSDSEALKMHKVLDKERCKTNGDPKECLARAAKSRKQPLEAKLEVFTFGWYNCVNDLRPPNPSTSYQEARDALEKKLIDRKCECDEP